MLRSMISICKATRAGDSMEDAIKKAESAEITNWEYESMTVRREAAVPMQVSDETKTTYEGNVSKTRRTLKRN